MLLEKWAVCLLFCFRIPLVAMVDSVFLSVIWPGAPCPHLLLKLYWTLQLNQNKIRQLSPFGTLEWLACRESRQLHCKRSFPLGAGELLQTARLLGLLASWSVGAVKFLICPHHQHPSGVKSMLSELLGWWINLIIIMAKMPSCLVKYFWGNFCVAENIQKLLTCNGTW